MAREVLGVLIGTYVGSIDKEGKGRWRLFGLRGVVELEPFAGFVGRLALLNSVLKHTINNRRGDLLLPLIGHVTDGLEQSIEMKARCGAGENHRGVIEKEQLFLYPVAKLREHGKPLGAVIAVTIFLITTMHAR